MEKKTIKVFVSMPFRGKTKSMVNFILEDIRIKFEVGILKHMYKAECICNFDYEAPETGNKKMYQLAHAIELMAECDAFVMLVNSDGKQPARGCKFEEEIWNAYHQGEPLYMVDDYAKYLK